MLESPLKQEIFLFSEMFLSVRGPPSLPVDACDGSLSLEAKRRGRAVNLSLPSRVDFANEWIYKRTPPLYRAIRKSLRDFRPLRYSIRDDHAEGEHVNRGTDTPSFCLTLQLLDMSTLLYLGCCAAEFGSSGGTNELSCKSF